MLVSDSHFEPTMTWRTKRNQIIKQVCIVLKFVIAATLNVMHVKRSTAGAVGSTAAMAYLVTFNDLLTDFCPPSTMRKFFSTSPVRTILAGHMRNGAFARAIFSIFLGWEYIKFLSAAHANKHNMRLYPASVCALLGTMLDFWLSLVETFSAICTIGIRLFCFAPGIMTFTRAKYILFPFYSIWLALNCFSAMITRNDNRFANSINSTFPRAMIDFGVVSLEFFPTLEAYFDHR